MASNCELDIMAAGFFEAAIAAPFRRVNRSRV
jgi:hypothetical protein